MALDVLLQKSETAYFPRQAAVSLPGGGAARVRGWTRHSSRVMCGWARPSRSALQPFSFCPGGPETDGARCATHRALEMKICRWLLGPLIAFVAGTASAQLAEQPAEPEELKFIKPTPDIGAQGEPIIATIGLRKAPGGQIGMLFTCKRQRSLGVAFQLHPNGTLRFDWAKEHSRKKDNLGLRFDGQYKMTGQAVGPEHKYSATVEMAAIPDRYWKSVPAPYLPIPPVENFFWSDWEHLRYRPNCKAVRLPPSWFSEMTQGWQRSLTSAAPASEGKLQAFAPAWHTRFFAGKKPRRSPPGPLGSVPLAAMTRLAGPVVVIVASAAVVRPRVAATVGPVGGGPGTVGVPLGPGAGIVAAPTAVAVAVPVAGGGSCPGKGQQA